MFRYIHFSNTALILGLIVTLSGCTTSQLTTTDEFVSERTGYELPALEDEKLISEKVDELLADTLELEQAIEVALFNNRHLQALYASLGIAQADLVQAGLPENPSLDTHIGYPVEEDHAP